MRTFLPIVAFTALLGLLVGCSEQSPLLTAEDYAASRSALAKGDYSGALARFPKGESGTFITTMERTYLNLLNGSPDIDSLLIFRDLLANRVRFHASRELKSAFYIETPEGYYASEHELIWMHLLLSWGFSLRGEQEKGCVEARQASHLLTARWSEEGHFDDPMLRVVLGGMWALCGDWPEAQVDFRRATKLDPALTWAQTLADRVAPPSSLFIVLGGIGMEPVWQPKAGLSIRSLRSVSFDLKGQHSQVWVDVGGSRFPLFESPDAWRQYRRHRERDNAIQEIIRDSRYGVGGAAEAGWYAGKATAAAAYWAGVTTAGIAAGVAVIYLSAEAGVPEGFVAGFVIPVYAFQHGHEVFRSVEKKGRKRLGKETDPARTYRFVRFLPDYVWVGWSEERHPKRASLVIKTGGRTEASLTVKPLLPRTPFVYLLHLPDTGVHRPASGVPHWIQDRSYRN